MLGGNTRAEVESIMTTRNQASPDESTRQQALRFVLLLGVVSLFADMTYEGARSVTGPFLAYLGASGTVVGVVAGAGELIGYGLRLASGVFSDRTGWYWAITICGYCINLLAVPLLALAGNWPAAASLMVAERIGKALRTPARDAMLSHASSRVGAGWAFGVHEALDQTGAVIGPLVVAMVLQVRNRFQDSFAVLLIPALVALTVLMISRRLYPHPRQLEGVSTSNTAVTWPKALWVYLVAIGFVAAGYVDFPLIAFHFEKTRSVPQAWVPVFYSVAMGVDALAALLFGRWFDRAGVIVLTPAIVLSAFFAPLTFWGGFSLSLTGMVLWGIGMGTQESVLRAAIAGMVAPERRGAAYGVFNAWYGVAWFLGSAALGILYDVSISGVVLFSMGFQLLAIPLILQVRR